jgi:hypothetical protein
MRLTDRLWEAARRNDEEALATYIEWRSDTVVLVTNPIAETERPGHPDPEGGHVIATPTVRPDLWIRFASGDLVGPALAAVGQIVNERLRGEIAPQLQLLRLRFSPRDEVPPLRLGTNPLSLIGAIWLQFATAVSENRLYRRCDYCADWTEVSRREANADRHYCSTAHRMKAYRERQEEAQRLAAAGVAIGEIATQLGSEADTVTNWIEKRRSERQG